MGVFDFFKVPAVPAEPFCDSCDESLKCPFKLDALCTVYNFLDNTPSKLVNLGLPNKTPVSIVLEKIDSLVGSNFNTPLVFSNNPALKFTLSGIANHTINPEIVLSSDSSNQLSIKSDGLYAKPYNENYFVKVNPTDIPAYLKDQIQGGTDKVVSVSVIDQQGLLTIQPKLDLTCLTDALRTDGGFIDLICQIRRYCDETCPYISEVITEISN